LELLGSYNPKTKATILNKERILMWHKDGAQISDTVRNLLITNGVIEGKKINVLPKKSPPKKEEEAPKAEAPSAAPVEETPATEPEVVPETPEEAVAEKASA
jgi:small subunit ribosomal protein S16